jgi:hypothetical protein
MVNMMYIFVFPTKSRDVTLSDIGKIETEKHVAVWHPVPPAPPPTNHPISIIHNFIKLIMCKLFSYTSS